jgi:hypothetical protein
MATNTIEYANMVTKEAQRLLSVNRGFSRGVNTQYDSSFGQTGAKIGDTLRLRMPIRPYVSNTANVAAQNYTESNVTLQIANRAQVAFNFGSNEMTTDIDKFTEWSQQKLAPAMSRIATEIDLQGLALAKLAYNSVGTPGTTPSANSTVNNFVTCRSVLNRFNCPQDNMRTMCVDSSAAENAMINSIALFNPSGQISSQYKKGMMSGAPVYGFNWTEDENIGTFTTGTRAGNATVNGANQTGANLILSNLTANTTFIAGDSFTIANVYSVNPENQQSTGHLQQFTVQANANADANGAATVNVLPAIVAAAANVGNGTVNALPANGAALTFIGNASTLTKVNVAYHKDAFVLGTADLIEPFNTGISKRSVYDGVSMRMWIYSDGSTDSHTMRFDVMYGWKLVRPELVCKLFG